MTLPLTPLQSVMAFESLRDPDSRAHWITLSYEIPGDWPATRLSEAWTAVAAANPALRTRFVRADGIEAATAGDGPPLLVADWDQVRETYPALDRWLEHELQIARGPGTLDSQRASAVRGYPSQADGRPCVLFSWTLHHLIADGSSLVQAVNDFLAMLAGRDAPAERPGVAAYHEWVARTGAIERARAYWKRELAGAGAARPLRLARAERSAADAPRLRTMDFRLPGGAATGLARFARRHRVSQAAVITSLWARLLAPYQDGDELCVGMTYSCRPPDLPGSADISGMLINTLPLRVNAGRPFATTCEEVMAAIFGGAEHAHLSYREAAECAGLPGAARLFHSTVIFENFAGRLAEAGRGLGLPGEARLVAELGTSADPLTLTVDLAPGAISGRLGWDDALFDGAGCQAVARRFGYWLERLDQLDDAGAGPVTLATAQESRAWQERFCSPAEPASWNVAALLSGRDQDRPAIRDEDGQLSYAELGAAVQRTACWLRDALGVGHGSRVALAGGRGARAATAVLAVWWLGAAWCPLDATAPAAHRQRVLDVLAPDAVVDLGAMPAPRGAGLPDPDIAAAVLAPGDVAYYVTTSGSTGSPKLVTLTAGGLLPLVTAWRAEYGAGPQHVLQLGSWAADVFTGDLLKAAATGGCLTIAADHRRTDLDHLIDLITRHRVTFAESTPQMLLLLLRRMSARGARPGHLRTLVAGSDTFREAERAEAVALLWDGVRLINGYGLSEATIESMVFDCASARVSSSGLCPIGVPLGGTAIRIVDEHLAAVPPGAAGELLIGGPGVMAGYRVAEGTDRGRLAEMDGIRWLRTSDRAVACPDGTVDFLGRSDSVVKVRGHRVELGAVENALLGAEGVGEAAVVPHDGQLVAFVSGSPSLTPAAVISHARAVLPAQSAPGLVAVLERLPRNASQKIDRTMLAARVGEASPAAGDAVSGGETAPAGEAGAGEDGSALRQALTAVWSDVLGRRAHPGRTFFDQGGHSLLALRLLDRLQRELPEYSVEMTDLFRYPTIAALQSELQRRGGRRE